MTGPSALRIAGTVLGERILVSWPSLRQRPQWPREQAGHLDEPPPHHMTAKELPEEY